MPFENLMRSATEKLRNLQFQLLDEGGGERHGAWEWTWIKPRDGGGHCYASLGAVELGPGSYRIEVWAGADNEVHFGRYLVKAFPDVGDNASQIGEQSQIVEGLVEAANRASVLSNAALTDSYLRRITSPYRVK